VKDLSELRVAIVHYWYVRRRGGERVVEALAEMFPQADLFALVVDWDGLPAPLRSRRVTTSFLQKLPGSKRYYRKLLPLFPLAVEQLPIENYDLVISSESGPAKGVVTSAETCHICYCHSPMRYLWDLYHAYRRSRGLGWFSRAVFTLSAHYVRLWDFSTAARVDYFVANSENVAARIHKHYRRQATVIHPPVEVCAGRIGDAASDYYLVVSPLVDYKRVDLAIAACARLGRPLRIIGDGEESRRLARQAGRDVKFLGYVPDDVVRENYAHCRALLFPGEEDFGLVPVEAHAFGRPVIAYGRGGVLETVAGFFAGETPAPESSTGVFFDEQSAESLVEAMRVFESVESRFVPSLIRSHAERFDAVHFKSQMAAFIQEKLAEFHALRALPSETAVGDARLNRQRWPPGEKRVSHRTCEER
jgi:glycosyltransferase involved in cell wall biosynthesis